MNWNLVLKTMRPWQWIKNLMIFPALVFSGHLTDLSGFIAVCGGFVVFCLLSGAVYLFNDVRDYENDRAHPSKKERPIASGALSIKDAKKAMFRVGAAGLILSVALNIVTSRVGFDFLGVCLLYLALQTAYTLWLKHVVILDVGCIAGGFVLRVLGGVAIINVPVSFWIIACTTLLALFLGFGKRRHELTLLSDGAETHRKILKEYSPYYLDQMISVVTASTVIAYALYTVDARTIAKLGTTRLPVTIPFVIYGIFRYLYLVHQKEEGGSPSRMLVNDRPLLINIGLWFLTVVALLYFR